MKLRWLNTELGRNSRIYQGLTPARYSCKSLPSTSRFPSRIPPPPSPFPALSLREQGGSLYGLSRIMVRATLKGFRSKVQSVLQDLKKGKGKEKKKEKNVPLLEELFRCFPLLQLPIVARLITSNGSSTVFKFFTSLFFFLLFFFTATFKSPQERNRASMNVGWIFFFLLFNRYSIGSQIVTKCIKIKTNDENLKIIFSRENSQ